MGSGNIHPIIIRTAPRFDTCHVHSIVNCHMELGSCLHHDYHLLTAIFLAHSLSRSPCNGWMGCSSTESQSSAACRGTKNPLGSCDNWTCVSSSSSLLSTPPEGTQFAHIHHLQMLEGFYSWMMLLERSGHAGCCLHSPTAKPSAARSIFIPQLKTLHFIKIQKLIVFRGWSCPLWTVCFTLF